MTYRVNILDVPESDADAAVTAVCEAAARDAAVPTDAEPTRRRPERGLAAPLAEALQRDDRPEQWLTSLSAVLARLGYDDRVVFCLRVDDRLEVVGGDDVDGLPADGWLGSLLAVAGVLLETKDLSLDGLSESEMRFLEWSAADLHLPLVGRGELVGLLSFGGVGAGGLSGLSTVEVLALECLGLMIAERLAEDLVSAAQPANEIVDEIVDVPIPTPVG